MLSKKRKKPSRNPAAAGASPNAKPLGAEDWFDPDKSDEGDWFTAKQSHPDLSGPEKFFPVPEELNRAEFDDDNALLLKTWAAFTPSDIARLASAEEDLAIWVREEIGEGRVSPVGFYDHLFAVHSWARTVYDSETPYDSRPLST